MRPFTQIQSALHALWFLIVLLMVGATACGSGATEAEPAPSTDPSQAGSGDGVTLTGTAPQATNSSRSVVLLTPHVPVDIPVPENPAVMDQLGRTFIPELLVVRGGQPVEFRNSENDLHNVRVIETSTGTTVMNVGMLMGVVYRQTFDRPGLYSVQCDLHTSMFADIVVTDTPYGAITDRQGEFSIADVRPGTYTLLVQYGEHQLEQVVTIDGATDPVVLEGLTEAGSS